MNFFSKIFDDNIQEKNDKSQKQKKYSKSKTIKTNHQKTQTFLKKKKDKK